MFKSRNQEIQLDLTQAACGDMERCVQRYAVLFFVITLRQPLLMLLLLPLLPMQALIYKCFYFSKLCNPELWCSSSPQQPNDERHRCTGRAPMNIYKVVAHDDGSMFFFQARFQAPASTVRGFWKALPPQMSGGVSGPPVGRVVLPQYTLRCTAPHAQRRKAASRTRRHLRKAPAA